MNIRCNIILFLLLLMGCSDQAGNPSTGHGGEAMVSGTLLKSNGEQAAGQEITLLVRDKSAQNFNDNDKIDSKCNANGEYSFSTEHLNNYTLSARSNNEYLYYPHVDLMKKGDHIELPQLIIEKGTKVIINPWWDDIKNNSIAVAGTPWIFSIHDTEIDTIYLPVGPLTLIRYSSDDDKLDTINTTIHEGIIIEGVK